MDDNFLFNLVDNFVGYSSSKDPTKAPMGYLIRGSQNVYKKLSGVIASRFGRKQYGPTDATVAGVVSSYEWNNNFGKIRPLRVANNKLSVLFNSIWYDLLTGLTKTRFVFDSWFEFDEGKDRLVMVNGDSNIYHWSGGIAAVSGGAFNRGEVISVVAAHTGGSYTVGDVLTIVGGNNNSTIRLTGFTGGPGNFTVVNPGTGYLSQTYNATGGTGDGTMTVTVTANLLGTLSIQDGTTWGQNGFASEITGEKSFVANGVTYTYSKGETTSTIYNVSPDPSSIPAGTIVIQSVQTVSNSPSSTGANDFIRMLDGQMFLGSYSSRIIYKSAQAQTGLQIGFSDFVNVGDLIPGDPDFVVLDSPPTGMIPKEGKMYVSAGTSDWYAITPNTSVPVEIPLGGSHFALVITDVQKIPGTGLSAALAHEFIENVAGDIFYVAQDNQLRKLGTIPNMLNVVKFPSISQDLQDELQNENFTGGHLKAIGEFLYITAPVSGRHYMHQTREYIDPNGSIIAERLWHSPQIEGISRFAIINGVVYGYSNQNPMMYQIWDTNQWHDDSPSGNVPYTCVMRIAYGHTPAKNGVNRVALNRFDKVYYEGYISQGTNLYGNIYFDYEGATNLQNVIINTVQSPVTFFSGENAASLGGSSLGDNPLGDGLVIQPNDQALLPKFRTICKVAMLNINCFEYALEIYSNDLDSRWEILALGANESPNSNQQATFLCK